MSRLAFLLFAVTACGGASSGDPAADAAPHADGAPIDQSDFASLDEGFRILHGDYFYDGAWSRNGEFDGRLVTDSWNVFYEVALEAEPCRLLTYAPGFCEDCADGLCTPQDECRSFPQTVDLGTVTIEGLRFPAPLEESYGFYYYNMFITGDIFDVGASIELQASGSDDISAFSLSATGVERLPTFLEDGVLTLQDGGDQIVQWSTSATDSRVRLTVSTPNQAHGLPVAARIECDAPDHGQIVIPQSIVEAFPAMPRTPDICAGHDCPFSSLVRYTRDQRSVDGHYPALVVGSMLLFPAEH